MKALSFCCSFRIKGISELIHHHGRRGQRGEGAFCYSVSGKQKTAEFSFLKTSQAYGIFLLVLFRK
jgi:hypothetical protein